jgi:serine/tyrosine/threonine adenylyltransferase
MMENKFYTMMASKLWMKQYTDSSKQVIDRLLDLMQTSQADYTNTFVYLSWYSDVPASELFDTPEWSDWKKLWHQEIVKQDGWIQYAQESMRLINPFIIPRNHILEELIDSGLMWEKENIVTFLEIFKTPYRYTERDIKLRSFPPGHDDIYQTFCGT